MSMRNALVAELEGDAGVSALVGTRIYPVVAARLATLPYIIFQEITPETWHHMTAAAGLKPSRWEMTFVASSASGAAALGEAVREALDGFQGTMGSGGNTASVSMCHRFGGPREDYEDKDDASPVELYTVIQAYNITHTESVPTF